MSSPTGAGQTIAVVDKSGKVVSTSKHIFNLLKEARAAYLERKAEILAAREAASRNAPPPRIRRAQTVNDIGSVTSRRSDRTRHTHRESRHAERPREHGHDKERRRSESHKNDDRHTRPKESRSRAVNSEVDSVRSPSVQTPTTPLPPYSVKDPKPLSRSATFQEESSRTPKDIQLPRRIKSAEAIDMDLAYGEPPPNLMMTGRGHDDTELNGLVGKASFLLDEAKCVQHSVKSMITNLQKNPEAMAAVALTLGEISTLVKKMPPGALTSIRNAAPAVFALLTSPQFLIAAGVGAGVIVIALGGYKIIKKIQAIKEAESPEQMIALSSEVNRVESWRQGVADIESQSVGTSVDGELITPMAARLSKLNLAGEQAAPRRKSGTRSVSSAGTKTVKTSRSHSSRESSSRDIAGTKSGPLVKYRGDKERETKPKPKPSPLRSLFKP